MGSESAENDYLADVLGSTDAGHEWARNNGYILLEDLEVELQALNEEARSDMEAIQLACPGETARRENTRYRTYRNALKDIAKKFDITLE